MAGPISHPHKPFNIPSLSQDHVVALLAIREPYRTAQWLQCCCFDDARSEVSQESLWLAYSALLGRHRADQPFLSPQEFFDTVVKTFEYVKMSKKSDQPSSYIVTGIRARRSPLPPKFIKMKPLEESTPEPTATDVPPPPSSPRVDPSLRFNSPRSRFLPQMTNDSAKVLGTYKEPVRCHIWLNACFRPEASETVALNIMWQTYQATFAPFPMKQEECLSLTGFADCVSNMFSQASVQTYPSEGWTIIKGLSARNAPFNFVPLSSPESTTHKVNNPDTTTKTLIPSPNSHDSWSTSTGTSTPSTPDESLQQLIEDLIVLSPASNTDGAIKPDEETIMMSIHELETNGIQLPDLKGSSSCCNPEDVDIAKSKRFSLDFLAALIRHGALELVSDYLSALPESECSLDKYYVSGEWPLIFFAIERNDVEAVKFMLKYGGSGVLANMTSSSHKIPVLAYAILLGEQAHVNTLEVVKLLLAAGAEPSGIPIDMWQDYMQRPAALLPPSTKLSTRSLWCTAGLRKRLASATTLSQRYYLWKADQQSRMKERTAHADEILGIAALRQLPYWLVGQDQASKLAALSVFDHLAFRETKPLTLLFSGPSGHGKTELAQRLADLLEVELTCIDCAPIRNQWGLLGSDPGYIGCQDGSKLNNFLGENNGTRTVVFLDEIDKSVKAVWDTLLVLFGSGRFLDKRNSKDINCSKTIFIMATNQGDKIIEKHWKVHPRGGNNEAIDTLQSELQTDFIAKFGAPFTGRIRSVVPFMPFNPGEQAVIAHGFMLNVFDRLRRPLDTKKKSLIAHGHLDIQRDEEICKHVAEKSYVVELGARAIENAVIQKVRLPLDSLWREDAKGAGKVDEAMNENALTKYVVQLEATKTSKGQPRVKIAEIGVTELPLREEILYRPVQKVVTRQ